MSPARVQHLIIEHPSGDRNVTKFSVSCRELNDFLVSMGRDGYELVDTEQFFAFSTMTVTAIRTRPEEPQK